MQICRIAYLCLTHNLRYMPWIIEFVVRVTAGTSIKSLQGVRLDRTIEHVNTFCTVHIQTRFDGALCAARVRVSGSSKGCLPSETESGGLGDVSIYPEQFRDALVNAMDAKS